MKKSLVIGGIVFVILLFISGILLFNEKNLDDTPLEQVFYEEQKQNDFVGEQITIMHKDFKAIIEKDWQEIEVSPSTYIYLPPNTEKEDVDAEIISIVVQFLGKNNQYTLNELLELGIENSKQLMFDFELVENSDDGKLNIVGKRIKFIGTLDGVKRNNLQVFGIKYDNLYSITYSCPINNCNSYAIYNTLIESFEPVKADIK